MKQQKENIAPFKFLDSFSESDYHIFFGREKETEELYSKIFQGKLMLVYGASGSGKSSIISCGLANKFNNSDWLPIHIRRGGNILRSTFDQIQKHSITNYNSSGQSEEELRKLLGSVFLDHFKPIYLIFDQFEELFIFGLKEEWRSFISAVRYIMSTDLDVKFIFVIRGEYLEFLSEFEEFIPEFFDNRIRIEKMTRKNALKSISGPAEEFNIVLEEGFEEKLIHKITPDKAHVELTFLQVFLDKIYREAMLATPEGQQIKFTNEQLDSLGQISDVLAEFVDEQLFKMEDPKAALTILKAFVSLQGTKTQKTIGDVSQFASDIGVSINTDKVEKVVSSLVNKRILREKDDNDQYELRHDSLAQKIFEKITFQERELLDVKQFLNHSYHEYLKREILLNDEDLIYIAPFERNLQIDKEISEFISLSKKHSGKRKKKRRIRTFIAFVILFLTITSIAGLLYSLQQKNKAEELASIALSESEAAQKQKIIAEDQRLKAIESENMALEQAQIASLASINAEEQRAEALRQRKLAIQDKKVAEMAKASAEKNELLAEESRISVEKERKEVFRMRMLGLSRELAIKSLQMVNTRLQALLAIQSYNFNKIYGGKDFQPEIFNALNSALEANGLNDRNSIRLSDQAILKIISLDNYIYAISANGSFIRISKDLDINDKLVLMKSSKFFNSLSISSDGKRSLIGTNDGTLIHFNNRDQTILWQKMISNHKLVSIAYIPKGLVALDSSGKIILLDNKGQLVNRYELSTGVIGAILYKGQLWIGLKTGEIVSFEIETASIKHLHKSAAKISAIAIDKEHGKLAIGYASGEISIYSMLDMKQEKALSGHTASISSLNYSPDGKYLLSSSFDRSSQLWDIQQEVNLPIRIKERNDWVASNTFTNNSTTFYIGIFDGSLRKFSLSNQEKALKLCNNIGQDLSTEEWQKYVAQDIELKPSCFND